MNDTLTKPQNNIHAADSVGIHKTIVPASDSLGAKKVFSPIIDWTKTPKHDSLKVFYNPYAFDIDIDVSSFKGHKQTNSVFEPHAMKVIGGRYEKTRVDNGYPNWFLFVLLFLFVIGAWIKSHSSSRLNQIFRGFFQPHYMNQIKREGNIFKEPITIGLVFIYYLTISLFAYIVIKDHVKLSFNVPNYALFGLILCGFVLFKLIKSSFIYLIGVLYQTKEEAYVYQLNTFIVNNVSGIIIAPFVVITLFFNTPLFVIICGCLISISVLYNLVRSIFLFFNNRKNNLLYNFLYLCTLEILPLLVVYRLVTR